MKLVINTRLCMYIYIVVYIYIYIYIYISIDIDYRYRIVDIVARPLAASTGIPHGVQG